MNDKSRKPSSGSKWWNQIIGITKSETARVCDKGHPMDPNWKTCAYCDADNRAHQKTTYEPENLKPSESMQRSINMERKFTEVNDGGSNEGHGATKFDIPGDVSQQREKADKWQQREKSNMNHGKLTGVVVTYKWRSQGNLFPLYEGRNVIGSESAESCDIYIPSNIDSQVSGRHAVILCRTGKVELYDELSTNGTFLNGKYVARGGVDVADGQLIKTGATVFEFRKFTSSGDNTQEGDKAKSYENDDQKDIDEEREV